MKENYRALPQARRVQLGVEEQKEVGVKTDDIAGTKLNSIVLEKRIENAA